MAPDPELPTSAGGGHLPFPVLIGDIGGTNTRLAVLSDQAAAMVRLPDTRTADHATIEDAIVAALAHTEVRPKSAVLASAGPIAGETVALVNAAWVIAPRQLMARFDLNEVILINDFEAQALALPDLGPEDLQLIGEGTVAPEAPRVVVGPGTGLGVGALINVGGVWIPVGGEGGHVDIGPKSPRDMAIWPHIERPLGRVAAETLISGGGLVRLYQAVSAVDGVAAAHTTPQAVSAAGLGGGDRQAAEAMALFATYLGRLAGDLAIVFMARGGVFLGGGIPPKIAPALQAGEFRAAFVEKAPHEDLLRTIVTAIVVKKDPALAGVAAFARAPGRFGVKLGGRRWRG